MGFLIDLCAFVSSWFKITLPNLRVLCGYSENRDVIIEAFLKACEAVPPRRRTSGMEQQAPAVVIH